MAHDNQSLERIDVVIVDSDAVQRRVLAGLIADCEMHVIAGSGHTLPTERPREVNALLRAFLSRLDAQAAA